MMNYTWICNVIEKCIIFPGRGECNGYDDDAFVFYISAFTQTQSDDESRLTILVNTSYLFISLPLSFSFVETCKTISTYPPYPPTSTSRSPSSLWRLHLLFSTLTFLIWIRPC